MGFSVDTKLFRELGELLVGRESTALVELIKNAYDADATRVRIFAEGLDSPGRGVILVEDDGVGMNLAEFTRGFLRIAGRSKTGNERRSPYFRRRYTGEKGVGRLAAHKLAHALRVTSRRWDRESPRDPVDGFPADEGVRASIDWDAIEELETLADVERSDAVTTRELRTRSDARAGTSLRLEGTRRRWNRADLGRFFAEVATLTPPRALLGPLSEDVAPDESLFRVPKVRDQQRSGPFDVEFAGDLSMGDTDVPALAEAAFWVIEVDCDAAERRLRMEVTPTRRARSEYTNAEGFAVDRLLPADDPVVSFQARIFQKEQERWPPQYRGVRVYYEGFRVLPYGDARDDWLELDRDYGSRAKRQIGRLQRFSQWDLPPGNDQEELVLQSSSAYFGGVFLTREGASDLQMLVNREGFLPGPHLDFVAEMVRLGIDLQTRLRYAATSEVKRARKLTADRQVRAVARAGNNEPPSAFQAADLQRRALDSLHEARAALAAGRGSEAIRSLEAVETHISGASQIVGEAASEATMYRVLASMGLEQAAFVHEVNSLALTAQTAVAALEDLAETARPPAVATRLRGLAAEMRILRDRLRRNAAYLVDVTGLEGRRRRSRQSLAERFARTASFFERAVERRGITVDDRIPPDLRTPPMFPAEVSSILGNLVSNAVKFAGDDGTIAASARQEDGVLVFRLENTGARVDLETSSRWFEPFRSTTTQVDEALGQGMGLGLTITRSLVDEYGGTIRFVRPSRGYATAIEVGLPTR